MPAPTAGLALGFLFFSAAAVAQTAPAPASAPAAVPAATARAAGAAFTGRITDQATGEGLPGATLYFPDLKQGAASGADGSFSFSNLPRGRFTLQVRSLGYNTVTQAVNTGAGEALAVKLTAASTEIGQVVVTGVSQATELRRSPIPTVVVDRTRLNQTSATNIVEALAHTPGISQISTGPAIGKPVIRGLGYTRVITLNNGAKQEGQQWGDEHGIEIDEFSIDRAEIIKGPGSLLYGSDAMAGVVNFVAADPVAEGRITGGVAANYQTNNRQQGYSLFNAGNLNGLNWMVRGTTKLAGNYRNRYDGPVFNSGFREYDGNGYVGLNKSWGYTHLTFSSFNQKIGFQDGTRDSLSGRFLRDAAVGGAVDTRPVTDDELRGYTLYSPYQRINHLRFGTDNNFILGDQGGRLTLQVNYQQSRRREFGNVLQPDREGLHFLLRTVDYNVRYFMPEKAGFTTTVGVGGLQQQNQNLGIEFLIPAYQLSDVGAFALTKRSLGKLDLSGGLRYDVRTITADRLLLGPDELPAAAGETKFPGFKSTFRNYSGSVGGAFNATDRLTFKANVSRGFRAPNIAELGSNGQHGGTIRYEIGDPNLVAETSLQLDAGVGFVSDHVSVSVDAFQNRIGNYIFPRRLLNSTGQGDSISTLKTGVFKYGQGDARLYGGEVSVDVHPHPLDWLHFENSFSMVRAEELHQPAGQRYLPFIPADRFQSELRVNFRQVRGTRLGNLYARAAVEHTFAQDRFFSAFNTETGTPGYTLVNAGVGTDLHNAQGTTVASVYLTGNNLFDVGYQSHLSRLKYADVNYANGRQGIFNMGRNFGFKLVVPLAFN
ncbi:MAG: TonB-dependent receptor [Hymenobacter sp.]